MLVNVVARDNRGTVADLSKDDFLLFDRGKPRLIQSFSVARFRDAVEAASRLPPNTFSNAIERQAVRLVSATVVLIDGLNTRVEHQAFARQRLVSLLKQIHPRERIALCFLGRSLRVLHDFTGDAKELARILSRFRGEVSPDLVASDTERSATGVPEVDRLLDELNAITADHGKVNRARITLAALNSIADHLSAVPGRKNLVWVSSGFPSSVGMDDPSLWFQRSVGMGSAREVRTFHEELERAARRINQANIAVYPVDAGGLATSPAFKSASIGTGSTQFPGNPPRADATGSTRATMERLAAPSLTRTTWIGRYARRSKTPTLPIPWGSILPPRNSTGSSTSCACKSGAAASGFAIGRATSLWQTARPPATRRSSNCGMRLPVPWRPTPFA